MGRPLSQAIQETVVEWKRVPGPIPWDVVFGNEAPLALEIGFGNGSFMEEQALAHPERNHVGIELSWTAATHLFRRLNRAPIENVRVLLGEAQGLVVRAFAPNSLCEVFINHPCPWPKARHLGRRLLDHVFLTRLAGRMQPGAKLTIVTDHAEYAQWLAGELAAQSAIVSCHETVEVPALEGRSPTKYQLKAMAQGIPIHYFEWRRPAATGEAADSSRAAERSEPDSPPDVFEMPTLTLMGEFAKVELFEGFQPIRFREQHQGVEVAVKLEAVYARPDRPVWLVETLVAEDQLNQKFGIDVVARDKTLLLKPSSLGQPYPTHGVKRAVWCVSQWLQSRHEGLRLQHESLGLAAPPEPWPPAEPSLSD